MSPELAAKIFPIFIGLVAAGVAAVSLVNGDYRLAGASGVLLAMAVIGGILMRVQSDAENRPPDDE